MKDQVKINWFELENILEFTFVFNELDFVRWKWGLCSRFWNWWEVSSLNSWNVDINRKEWINVWFIKVWLGRISQVKFWIKKWAKSKRWKFIYRTYEYMSSYRYDINIFHHKWYNSDICRNKLAQLRKWIRESYH